MINKVVIGAGYGDEGKGLMTDYLCSVNENPLVVRFNGGPQAGHTVQMKNGNSHIFSSFGSGTLRNVPSYFSKHTLVDPVAISNEYTKLVSMGLDPILTIDPDCALITPADIMWNHYIEAKRTKLGNKHGSCGMGIFATKKRSEICKVTFGTINTALQQVKDYYISLMNLEPNSNSKEYYLSILNNDRLWIDYKDNVLYTLNVLISIDTLDNIRNNYSTLIFEGAQGLLLDEQYGDMPYCTPSNTGVRNVLDLIDEDQDNTEVIYVTRSYLTRHGAGPLRDECTKEDLGIVISDNTNVTNRFQDHLRYAPMDWKRLSDTIDLDFSQCKNARRSMATTWLDQVPLTKSIMLRLPIENWYLSYGPTAEDIRKI